MTKRKRDPFKRFIKITNLNKNKDFDNHLVNVVNKMIKNGKDKINTLFKTFYFTVEKIENRKNKYFVSNKYYGISSTYKFN